jgi:2-polyprenyl-3-methyl-5-hydroxy-6-metoxy-1,4-benzoquinol methylase
MTIQVDPEKYEFDALLALAEDLSDKRVLEIGCGNGRITTHLAQFASHVTAIDPNEERIATAIEQMPPALANKISYQAIPLADLPPGERFDLALLSWSL